MSSLKILITKLSTAARTALEKSANACVLQQNGFVAQRFKS
nr:hypothetical protein [Acinetobacter baumannii]